jgi:hypothetical protein
VPRRLLGLLAAVVVAGALAAPVVLTVGGGPARSDCVAAVSFRGQTYERRAGSVTQHAAIGVGTLSGCGQTPTNVNVRSLDRVSPVDAISIDNDTLPYVRSGVCGGADGRHLDACLRRRG